MAQHMRRRPALRDLALGCLIGAVLVLPGSFALLARQQTKPEPTLASATLCSRALNAEALAWDTAAVFQADVAKAQRQSLTVEQCRATLGLAAGTVQPQQAAGPVQAPPLAQVELDGTKPGNPRPVVLHYQDIEVAIDSVPSAGAASATRVPVFSGREAGKPIFSVRLDDATDWKSVAEVRHLDPATGQPQIILSAYTGGAHCCTETRIVTQTANGWQLVDAGEMDGDAPYSFVDLDGDGGSELISVDNRFLYAFDCYACSYAPTVIQKLAGTGIRTVTRDPRYRPFLRHALREMETDDHGFGHSVTRSYGYLAGWVAQKSLVGELADAWKTMLLAYRRETPLPFEACLNGAVPTDCPGGQTHRVDFPAALAAFLVQTGYLTADQVFWLGKLPGRK